jgi:hypothetical protein
MGICSCEVHGSQSWIETCPHIGEAFRKGVVLQRFKVFSGLLNVEVCNHCFQRHNLSRFEVEPYPEWDEHWATYDLLHADSEGHCLVCVAAAELAAARREGRPDPFPAYERTLTFLQSEIVEKLDAILLRSFDFRRSVVDSNHRALSVCHGSITYPLTVTVYYVTDREQQDAILQCIANFFKDVQQRQYRVQFLRSENWGPVAEHSGTWGRGPEEIIRDYENDPPERPVY